MIHTVKAIEGGDEWLLDILGVPFGSANDRDSDGEYFDALTKFHEDKFGAPPLVHFHGMEARKGNMDSEYVGKTLKRWVDDAGVWFRAQLDKASGKAEALWEAARNGTLRASSGSAPHLARIGDDGHIQEWPVVELSVVDIAAGKGAPRNRYAVAVPVTKALYAKAGIEWPDSGNPEAEPEADTSAASADSHEVATARARAIDIIL